MHTRIDSGAVTTGQTVYFKYDLTALSGPYKVVKTYRDHEGAKVLLRDSEGNERPITIADDEDYGALSFYTE
jgi:hypothetical protein